LLRRRGFCCCLGDKLIGDSDSSGNFGRSAGHFDQGSCTLGNFGTNRFGHEENYEVFLFLIPTLGAKDAPEVIAVKIVKGVGSTDTQADWTAVVTIVPA
jgi:hypothetical protein